MSMSTAVSSSGSPRIRSAAPQPVELGHADVHQHDGGPRAAHHVHRGQRPSAASPTTRMSGSASRITRKPARSSRWSSAMTTSIGAVAGSGATGPAASSSRQRTCEAATRSETPRSRSAPARRIGSATRGPAIWQTTSVARISPGPAASHSRLGDDHRRAVQVVAVRQRLARVEADAQRRAGAAALHVDRAARPRPPRSRTPPSARRRSSLTSRPPCSAIASPQRREVLRGGRHRRLVARAAEGDAEPTSSVNRIVTKGPSMARHHHRRSRARVLIPRG